MSNVAPRTDAPAARARPFRLTTSAPAADGQESLLAALTPVLQQVATPVWLKDVAGRYRFVNPACAALHRLEPQDMLGKSDHDLHGNECMLSSRLLDEEALQQAVPLVAREWFPDALAVPVTVQVTRQRVLNGGAVVGLVCSAEPVQALSSEVPEAHRTVAHHFALLAHEFRSPLGGAMGLIRTLAQATNLTEPQRKMLLALQGCGDHLADLASDMLDIDHALAGQLAIWPVACDLRQLIHDVVDWTRPRVDAQAVELRCSLDPRLPKELLVDPLRLRQVLINLLSNAVRHTKKGFVAIRLQQVLSVTHRAGLAGPRPTRWRLEVEDTGDGISEVEQRTLFQPFRARRTQPQRSGSGAGLGLPICHQIVQAMGGQLKLRSQPGVGSRFWFEFDVAA